LQESNFTINSQPSWKEYENMNHLDFGSFDKRAAPLANPKLHLASLATQVTEVIAGVRSVEQLSMLLNEHVYEGLRVRAAARARRRLELGKRAVMKPTEVVNVRYQCPAEGVIESVVVLSNRDRARAVAIRLEEIHDRWRATNIGFL
jgi:hypothetical protein